jgi:polyvinyl alcohol dehydrogenase (cytochrome)
MAMPRKNEEGDMRRSWIMGVLVCACTVPTGAPREGASVGSASSAEVDARADWPMFGHDMTHSFANPASGLRPGNVGRLQQAWFFPSTDLFSAQAVVSDGVVFLGGWDGYFYAIDQRTGRQRWRFALDCQNAIIPVPPQCLAPGQTPPPGRESTDGGLVTSSAAVVDGTVYFGGGRTLYALDARTGALRWKHVVCGNPDDPHCTSDANDGLRIFSSPTVYGGNVLVGVSSDGQVGYRGAFLAFDQRTGAQRWRFEIDPVLDASGNPILNAAGLPAAGRNRGCGNVWSSGTVDTTHDVVAFGTADCNNGNDLPYHSGVLALDVLSGRLRWAFTPHAHDTTTCDVDFGATANVITSGDDVRFGIGGKDGTYYLLDAAPRDPHGRALWATNVVFGGSAGGFYGGAAYDGARTYSATGYGDFIGCDPTNPRDIPFQENSVHAFDVRRGKVAWEGQLSQSFAATTAGDGVIFTTFPGSFAGDPPALHVNDAASGALLVNMALPASTEAPATPVAGMLLVPMGNFLDGSSGGVAAYVVE